MSNTVEVTLPDIGDFQQVEIIEVLVAVGDQIDLVLMVQNAEVDAGGVDQRVGP